MPAIQWVTCGSNPLRFENGQGSAVTGWRLHALRTDAKLFSELNGLRALCGLAPRHGWDLDMYIDRKCHRCSKIAARYGDKDAIAQLEADRIYQESGRG